MYEGYNYKFKWGFGGLYVLEKVMLIRGRCIYFIVVVIIMVVGLVFCCYGDMLFVFLYEYVGDVLWVGMIYFGFCMVWIR